LTNNNILFISNKEDTAIDPVKLPTAFREIERWANGLPLGSSKYDGCLMTFSDSWALIGTSDPTFGGRLFYNNLLGYAAQGSVPYNRDYGYTNAETNGSIVSGNPITGVVTCNKAGYYAMTVNGYIYLNVPGGAGANPVIYNPPTNPYGVTSGWSIDGLVKVGVWENSASGNNWFPDGMHHAVHMQDSTALADQTALQYAGFSMAMTLSCDYPAEFFVGWYSYAWAMTNVYLSNVLNPFVLNVYDWMTVYLGPFDTPRAGG
jgi:hypothetical protein